MNPILPQTFAISAPAAAPVRTEADQRDARLFAAAQQLETGFLTEMLRAAGVGAARSSFGGGAGEEQFSSFLLEEQAREMVQAGGLGLAQSLFDAMKARSSDA